MINCGYVDLNPEEPVGENEENHPEELEEDEDEEVFQSPAESSTESESEEQPPVVQVPLPKVQEKLPAWYGFEQFAKLNLVEHMACNVYEVDEVNTLKEALESKYAKEWKKAVDQEFMSLCDMKTWKLVKLPADWKPISCKWVFHMKYDWDGKVERFKSHLVASGFA